MGRYLVLATIVGLLGCGGHRRGAQPVPSPPTSTTTPPTPDPQRADVLVARAKALRAEGDAAGARARLETALEAAPGHPEAGLELADLLVADGQELGRAATLLAPLEDPGDGRVALVLGRFFDAQGEDDAAAAAYGAALTVRDDPDARLRRAIALGRLGRNAEAIGELERLRVDRPGDAFARTHLADAYEAAGRNPEAETELRWLAELQPDRAGGWERLARFYERRGRERDARAAAERALAAGGAPSRRTLRPLLPSKR